jgi:2,3-diketo-5-methylthio-1-phosphopentane phosphatase
MRFIPVEDRVYKVFVDFDGTITTKDVGEHMFLEFGDAEKAKEIIDRWIKKEITSTESWLMLCETIKNFNKEDFDKFLSEMKIDPTFFGFENYCRENNIEMYVLSDGLDYYINKVLANNKLHYLKLYSNKLNFNQENKLVPFFPNTDEECKSCANCKRNHIINNSSDDDYTIYIGDGYSDTCPAQFTDFVFAKNSLLKYCEKERISYFPFNNFNDVTIRMEELRKKRRLRKRHQAELKRKDVYQQG